MDVNSNTDKLCLIRGFAAPRRREVEPDHQPGMFSECALRFEPLVLTRT